MNPLKTIVDIYQALFALAIHHPIVLALYLVSVYTITKTVQYRIDMHRK